MTIIYGDCGKREYCGIFSHRDTCAYKRVHAIAHTLVQLITKSLYDKNAISCSMCIALCHNLTLTVI